MKFLGTNSVGVEEIDDDEIDDELIDSIYRDRINNMLRYGDMPKQAEHTKVSDTEYYGNKVKEIAEPTIDTVQKGKDAVLRNTADLVGMGGDLANTTARLSGDNEYDSPVDAESIKKYMKDIGLIENEKDQGALDTILSLVTPAKATKLVKGFLDKVGQQVTTATVPLAKNAAVEVAQETLQRTGSTDKEKETTE